MKDTDLGHVRALQKIISHTQDEYLIESDKLINSELVAKAAHLYSQLSYINRELYLIADELNHLKDKSYPTKDNLYSQLEGYLYQKDAVNVKVTIDDEDYFGLSSNDIPCITKVWYDEDKDGVWYEEESSIVAKDICKLTIDNILEITRQVHAQFETPFGKTFEFEGKSYIVANRDDEPGYENHRGDYCYGCAFKGISNCKKMIKQECSPTYRADGRDIIFKKKGGEK